MPSVVGFVKIINAEFSAVIQFGDSVQVSPQSTSKTYAGSGSFLTASLTNSNNAISSTHSIDPDLQDNSNNQVGNGIGIV